HAQRPASPMPQTVALPVSSASVMEEGKALYENGQYIAALGKFMTVLRRDPHQPEARRYLRMVIDVMRQKPSADAKGPESVSAIAADEDLRQMLQKRSLFTLDLKAIPGVHINFKDNTAQVDLETSMLFADKTGGLKEQGVPVLDRVAAWLKTFGQQPVIIHCYPEELEDPAVNGSLFLSRYAELYNFFTEERKLAPQRFVSADLLASGGSKGSDKAAEIDSGIAVSTSVPHVVIETVGSQASYLEGMPSPIPRHALARPLELAVTTSRSIFNPEEGEWASLDLAALTRTGLRSWTFTISPVNAPDKAALTLTGKGNLLKRVSWDGHDEKSGSFVPSGTYRCHLDATDSDGTVLKSEVQVHVQRTGSDEEFLSEKPPSKPAVHKHHKPHKAAAPAHAEMNFAQKTPAPAPASAESASAASGETAAATPAVPAAAPASSSDDTDSLIDSKPPAQSPPAAGSADEGFAADDSSPDGGDSVHAIWKQVIQFEPGETDLKPTLKASLERIGKTLEVYPLQKVRILGFAMTSEADAAALAKKRAEAVRSILVGEYHVDRKRVIVAGGQVSSAGGASKVELSITN